MSLISIGVIAGCGESGGSSAAPPATSNGTRKRLDLIKAKAEQAPAGKKS